MDELTPIDLGSDHYNGKNMLVEGLEEEIDDVPIDEPIIEPSELQENNEEPTQEHGY